MYKTKEHFSGSDKNGSGWAEPDLMSLTTRSDLPESVNKSTIAGKSKVTKRNNDVQLAAFYMILGDQLVVSLILSVFRTICSCNYL